MSLLDTKIGLGIDFSAFDTQLKGIASRIENAGKGASVKVGAIAGDLAGGKLDTGKIADLVASTGTRIAAGIGDGLRQASSLMLGFGARTNSMLDRLTGSAVTIFRRIDAAMKFPTFDSFFKTAQLRLTNFSAIFRKPLSDLDIAMKGGMGKTLQNVSRVLKALFDQLAQSIAGALKGAVADVVTEFAKLNGGIGRAEASAADLLGTTNQIGAAAARAGTRFSRFAAMGAPGTARRPFPGTGRRIGSGTNFTAPAPRGSQPLFPAAEFQAEVNRAFSFVAKAAIGTASIFAKVGAALISVPLRAGVAFGRLSNFVSSLGDVGKRSFGQLYEQHGIFVGSLLAGTKIVTGLARSILNLGTLGAFKRAGADAGLFAGSVSLARGAVGGLTGKVRSLGREILVAFGVAGAIYKTVQFLKDGVVGASNLNEAVSRSKVVFGNTFAPVEAQVNRLNRAFGLSRTAQLDVASGFAAMAQGAGYTEAASAKLANLMTQMAADLSSSVNIPFEEAGQRIRAALAGEAEPLRKFGANITETNVQAYALANGIAKSAKSMNDQQKIAARAGLVMQGLGYAQGDLARTADQAANQFRKAGGGVAAFAENMGKLLMPTVNVVVTTFNSGMEVILGWFERNAAGLAEWAGKVATFLGNAGSIVSQFVGTAASEIGATWDAAFGRSMGTVAEWGRAVIDWTSKAMAFVDSLAHNWGSYWQIVKSYGKEAVADMDALLAVIPENTGRVIAWLGRNWMNLFKDLGRMVATAGDNMVINFQIIGVRIGDAVGTAFPSIGEDLVGTFVQAFAAVLEKAARFAVALPLAMMGGAGAAAAFDRGIPKFLTHKAFAQEKFHGLLEGFKATSEALPELAKPAWANFAAERQKFWDEIAADDKRRAEQLANAGGPAGAQRPKPPGAAAADAAKPPEYKLASAVEIGSKEAYSIVARSLSPRGRDPIPNQQLQEQRRTNQILGRLETRERPRGMDLVVK